jgi:hypothetical protein
MGSALGHAPRSSRIGSRMRLVGALFLMLSLVAPLLTACAPDAKSVARTNKAKLDAELHTASTVAGVPARRLSPIVEQENALAANTSSGSSATYQAAADGYAKLYQQLVALESLTPSQAQALAASDLDTLQVALTAAEHAGIADVTAAAARFDFAVPAAKLRLTSAKTTKDYFGVDSYILDQNAAVTQLLPDYQQIQALSRVVVSLTAALSPKPQTSQVLQCATEGGEIGSFGIVPAQFWAPQNGYPINATSPVMVTPQVPGLTYYFSSWPAQALAQFQSARTADDYSVLGVDLQAQVGTLTQDLSPSVLVHDQAGVVMAGFQNDVRTYQTDAQADNAYLRSHRATTHDVPDYIAAWNQSNTSQGFAPPSDFFPNVPDFRVDAKFAREAAQDATALASAQTPGDLAALTKTVRQQEQALAFPLLKVTAYYDTNITLQALINQGQSTTTNVTFNGVLYKTPNAYEYADDDLRYDKKDTVGIQDAQTRFDQAVYRESNGYDAPGDATADYQAVENEAQMLIHNLSAMITNLAQMPKNNAARIAWSMKPHKTDFDLIDYYGLQNTRVIVVSLREQKARLFDHGKLVIGADGKPYAFDVTTGSPDKPTVPGLHCALPPLKGPPHGDIFKSPDPPGSPFYYNPTPVHYSFGYSLYGYFMHDGWWRDYSEMGYLTNLPHYDPAAFNGGSHGCINFHYANGDMAKVYAFSSPGIPIIVY